MALIKCPECGQNVSSNATRCPNCGCPIESIKSAILSVQKSKVKKGLRYLLLFILGILCFTFVCISVQRLSHRGYYNGYKWGTSFETLQKDFPEDADSESNQSGDGFSRFGNSFEGISNLDALEDYNFDDNKLYSVSIMLFPTDDPDLSSHELAELIVNKYDRFYGDSESSKIPTASMRVYKWHASKSNITLYEYESNFVMITYEDPSYVKSSKTEA